MTAGASKAEPTITRQPALAPSPQPRPAPTARSLPPKHAATGGQNWTPIRGQIWKPIDSLAFTFTLCNDIIGDLDPIGHRFAVLIDPVQVSLSFRDRFKARSKHDF